MNDFIDPRHLREFSEKLSAILREEVEKGNPVVETHAGWPEERTVMVFLHHDFVGDYRNEELEFHEVNDPHYWKSEYFDPETGHILACKYGDAFSSETTPSQPADR